MSDIYLAVAIGELSVVAVLLIRLARGPSVGDRVVALNAISTQATLSVLFVAALAGRDFYADVALWLASFSYLGALVWARYLERGLL